MSVEGVNTNHLRTNAEAQLHDFLAQSSFGAYQAAWQRYEGPRTPEARDAFWGGWVAARRHDARQVAQIFGLLGA